MMLFIYFVFWPETSDRMLWRFLPNSAQRTTLHDALALSQCVQVKRGVVIPCIKEVVLDHYSILIGTVLEAKTGILVRHP